MKTVSILAAGAALYGGSNFIPAPEPGVGVVAHPSAGVVYRLTADGSESCLVTRGNALSPGTFAIRPAADCDALLPGLARAAVWRETEDGMVAFDRDDATKMVAFSVADGDGYLSYAPATPLLQLARE
jgi:hypothetical protein